jgi:hypothetical protein
VDAVESSPTISMPVKSMKRLAQTRTLVMGTKVLLMALRLILVAGRIVVIV